MQKMRKMKDSGIEWIGEIPEGWKIGQIGQLYSERRTKVSDKDYPPLSVTMKGILPQLSTAAKTDAHDDRKLVCKGDFAINSRSDRRGSCGISEQDGSISLINTVLQPRGEMNPGYYNWLFHTSMFADEFYKWGHGIVDDLWTTGWSDMKKIGVPVPSKCEQKQLAEHLNVECSNIDAILSKTRSSIEEYKKLKQTVITQAVTKGVRGEREMKDSGVEWIGEIPEEWNKCKLKNISIDIGDGLHGTPKFDDSGEVYFINGNNFSSEYVEPKFDTKKLCLEESLNYPKPELTEQTIMISLNGSYGKVCLYRYFPMLLGKSAGYITLLPSINRRYVRYYLFSTPAQTIMTLSLNGTTIPNLSLNTLYNFPTILPSASEQAEIADYLDAKCAEIDGLIAKKEQLVKELESYKKSLIYEVVTGKREV